jgi:hypothetical protein
MEKNSLTTFTYYHTNPTRVVILVLGGVFCFLTLIFAIENGIHWLTATLVILFLFLYFNGITFLKQLAADKKKLTLSTDGIQYGSAKCSTKDIEAVAIFIYAFDGFEYRDGFVNDGRMQSAYVRAPGDKNTISFRTKGRVFDFTFYLEDYAQFCTLRKVLNDWIAAGINVAEKQAFDDDFIQQEMNYYGTPSGL